MEKAKCLSRFSFKSNAADGTLCKTYVWVHANGVTIINQLFLVNGEKDNPAWTKLYSKFGKTLYVVAISFKYPSLLTIIDTTTKVLQSSNVKSEDLLK